MSIAYFSHARGGLKENSIKIGDITFQYIESGSVGNGISITDAFPISDEEGKLLIGEGNIFDFKITANLSSDVLEYEVVVDKLESSTLPLDAVKFYLTDITNGVEKEISTTINSDNKVKTLDEFLDTEILGATGKTIYQGTIGRNIKGYEKKFRARMWINEEIDWTDNSYMNTSGKFRINVYANTSLCKYKEGDILKEFSYIHDVESFEIPCDGTYKLEVWGAQGGQSCYAVGGSNGPGKPNANGGGYSSGNIILNKGENLFVVVGGSGSSNSQNTQSNGGYNGGGKSGGHGTACMVGSGGGATHIATTNRGVLQNYDSYRSEVIIVAGGGGGTSQHQTGGTGGGINGGKSSDNFAGGAQSSGYKFGLGASGGTSTSGYGALSGGGGGWYGGSNGYSGFSCAAGGGSGYLNTSLLILETTNMQNGVRYGDGYAKITLVSLD